MTIEDRQFMTRHSEAYARLAGVTRAAVMEDCWEKTPRRTIDVIEVQRAVIRVAIGVGIHHRSAAAFFGMSQDEAYAAARCTPTRKTRRRLRIEALTHIVNEADVELARINAERREWERQRNGARQQIRALEKKI